MSRYFKCAFCCKMYPMGDNRFYITLEQHHVPLMPRVRPLVDEHDVCTACATVLEELIKYAVTP